MSRLTRSAVVLTALVLVPTLAVAQTAAPARPVTIIQEVRGHIAKDDFATGEQVLRAYQAEKGWTPEALEALSWLGRGSLAADRLDEAERYARETYRLSLDALKTRELDAEKNLPIALGAAIEVQAHVTARRGARSEAVYTLGQELATYKDTSIATRILKNINLLTLEGKPALPIKAAEFVGETKPPTLDELKGRPVLLFFWAHWCPDCKAMAPMLAKLQETYGPRGLALVGPTQRYGYVAGGATAGPAEEMAHIEAVRQKSYGMIASFLVPVDEETFKNYGSSTTPTVVLVDRRGIVQMYHPGKMTLDELEPRVRTLVEGGTSIQ